MSHRLPPLALQRHQAQTVRDDASTRHKINYLAQVSDRLNVKGYQNNIIGSKDTAILLNMWFLPIGGAASRRDCFPNLFSLEKRMQRVLLEAYIQVLVNT